MGKKQNKQEQRNALLSRILSVKEGFHVHNYIAAYELKFGIKSEKQKTLIRRVWGSKAVDEDIIKNLEKLKESFKIK